MDTTPNNADIKVKILNNNCNSTAQTKNFKRVSESFTILLNNNEPNINNLIQVEAEAKVINVNYMITPNPIGSLNIDGSALTGFKLAVDINIIENIVYEECFNGNLYTITKNIPLSTFIILDNKFNISQKANVQICVEDIQIQTISAKKIIENITLFLQVI